MEDALRSILNGGGTVESDWSLTRALEVGDRATDVSVLRDLYDKMKAKSAAVDLNALWRELGVGRGSGRIEFNDAAPLAAIRKAITKRKTR